MQKALSNAHTWILNPNEDNRIQAETWAKKLQLETASSWINMAIFWSGGSIAPENQPSLDPEPFMCGHAVYNAIMISAKLNNIMPDTQKIFLRQGMHIAMGGNGKIA